MRSISMASRTGTAAISATRRSSRCSTTATRATCCWCCWPAAARAARRARLEEIEARIAELSFNTSFMREMRMFARATEFVAPGVGAVRPARAAPAAPALPHDRHRRRRQPAAPRDPGCSRTRPSSSGCAGRAASAAAAWLAEPPAGGRPARVDRRAGLLRLSAPRPGARPAFSRRTGAAAGPGRSCPVPARSGTRWWRRAGCTGA